MSVLIGRLSGSRGRSIAIYDNKCIITTDITVGSILTQNALDGQKTIFYIDVIGVQFKRSGLTIGYLQLETGSMQMNNQDSNSFSENTFTFEDGRNGISNNLMEQVHTYIIDTLEGYKYGFSPKKDSLYSLLHELNRKGLPVNKNLYNQMKIELKEQEEQRQQEELQLKKQEQQHSIEIFQNAMQENGLQGQLEEFLKRATMCSRILDIQKLWITIHLENNPAINEIDQKINTAAHIERMYGVNQISLQNLLNEILELVTK